MHSRLTTIDNVEAWNDDLARQHDIDDYYARSPWPIRLIESCRLAIIRRMVDAKPSDEILEVGCGGGHVLRLFPDSSLTGVDVSGVMLAKARRNLDGYRVRLLKGALAEVDMTEASFDKAVCSEVLEHVAEPAEMLAEIRRLLRPGGRAVITLPNDPLIHRLKSLVTRFGLGGRSDWGGDDFHLRAWTIPQMRELLSAHFHIRRERFAPSRVLPIRCCFLCTPR